MAELEPTTPAPSNGGSRPVPDPTELTDRAIARLENSLKEYIEGQLGIRDERLRGIDEATKLRLGQTTSSVEGFSGEIDAKVNALERLHNERLDSIQTQFRERDTRAERESRDNKVAVDAAFAAQKEAATKQDEANAKAIDKSERATAETIKTNQELNKATTDALTKSLDEVKLEVRGITAVKLGASENRTEARLSTSAYVAIAAVIVSFISVAVSFGLSMMP